MQLLRPRFTASFLATLALFTAPLMADDKLAPASIAAVLQPFVESHSLAGAVALAWR